MNVNKHKVFIISGASGAGKGTIINGVLKSKKFNLRRGVNITTRKPEARDKIEPHFSYVSPKKFKQMIKVGEFLEYDFHYQNYYGVSRRFIERQTKNHHLLLEADVNGALKIKKKKKNVVLIYILVGFSILRKRLERRSDETRKGIAARIKRAELENKKGRKFDYLIGNPEGYPDVAINKVLEIIEKELQR